MSQLLPRFVDRVAEAAPRRRGARRPIVAPFDLVWLARKSLGDRGRELELLRQFESQCGLCLARLGAGRAGDVGAARMLGASARMVGAHAIAAACDGFAAVVESGAPADHHALALDILTEEVEIARAWLAELV